MRHAAQEGWHGQRRPDAPASARAVLDVHPLQSRHSRRRLPDRAGGFPGRLLLVDRQQRDRQPAARQHRIGLRISRQPRRLRDPDLARSPTARTCPTAAPLSSASSTPSMSRSSASSSRPSSASSSAWRASRITGSFARSRPSTSSSSATSRCSCNCSFGTRRCFRCSPARKQSISFFGLAYLSNRGLVIPRPSIEQGAGAVGIAFLVAIAFCLGLGRWARHRQMATGQRLHVYRYMPLILIGLPVIVGLVVGAQLQRHHPGARRVQLPRWCDGDPGVSGAVAWPYHLHRRLHRRDRARRHPRGEPRADGSGALARPQPRQDAAARGRSPRPCG